MADVAVDAALTLNVESCRGFSAYELAVQHGFQGTEAEWLGGMVAEGNVTVNGQSKDVNGNITLAAQHLSTSKGETVENALAENAQALCAVAASLAQTDAALAETQSDLAAMDADKLDKSRLFNALTQTEAGYALDARQGRELEQRLATRAVAQAFTVLLPVEGWASEADSTYTQTAAVPGVQPADTLVVSAAPACHTAYCEAGVYGSAQGAGTLAFTAAQLPEAPLTANVLAVH